ncbi:diaminobutyrate--2-oxoglutarate transaminase family protein [Parafrankia sp. EUN1f]|uniref:diaminobutyrate--2-oxoglutarate transaminase family protein n=1 Tax=Parafrankia sp. EUN1f TaxID=102897 RepID=UPI0001C45E0C|nr:diaminobutyrate--2-oxoglutarate transaminase family protein [Parafrankia sp. EUN1f]EFC83977.1 2,4-diaminobutyrate 4-transaminase [Parafrankia sp. EUN1f]
MTTISPADIDASTGEAGPNDADPNAAAAILARQATRESAARTYARSLPIVPTRATGSWITGADGRRYLDFLAGAGTLATGHNHPAVVASIERVLRSGAPLHVLDMATPQKDAFTEELANTLPAGLREDPKLLFCGPTGADAVEAALKLAHTVTGRQNVLAFTGAYHGMTAGALAVTGKVPVKEPLPTPSSVVRLPFPYPYRCPFGVGGPASAEISAHYVEQLLDDPCGGITSPAAMILEVVQGEGGVVPAPDGWLRAMRELTSRRGIPLIVDEVQTGVGRTGTFWACERAGVVPDMLVMSKAIGGGLPLAVVAYRADLDVWAPGAHAGTFRGNQLAMAAGLATLRLVRDHGLSERAAVVGDRLLAGLNHIARGTEIVGDVRGRGLMLGVEIVDPHREPDRTGARPPDAARAAAIRSACLDRGLIIELGGRHDAVLRLLPPLTITDEEADLALEILADAIALSGSPELSGAAERMG